jgi:hypothetical protein
LSPPPQVERADLPPPPQAQPTRGYVPPATTTPRHRRSFGFWALLGAGGCLTLVVLMVGAVGLLAALGGGSGKVAEKPKREHKAAQQEQPQKDEQPQNEEQAQGGKQERQGGGGQKPEPQKPEPQKPSFANFGDGTYQVGADLQPGTYRTRMGSPNCYWERLRNFSGGMNGILANGGTSAPAIVTIQPTDAGFNSQGCGTWTKDLSAITASKTSFGAGTYIVGTDMVPGTYRSSGGNNCYYERLRDFTGGMNSIIANGNTNNPTIVTIRPTDAGFQSQNCGTWTQLE